VTGTAIDQVLHAQLGTCCCNVLPSDEGRWINIVINAIVVIAD